METAGEPVPGAGRSPSAQQTIPAALAAAQPGDRILVPPGRYGRLDLYGLRGRPDAWITLECLDPDDPPVIDVRDGESNGIDVQQCEFVGVFGFRVLGSPDGADHDASGIAVFRGSRHIRIWGCEVRDFPGGGVNCFWVPATTWAGAVLPAGGWDCVDVCFNSVTACCTRSPYNTSGISFFGADARDDDLFASGVGYRALQNVVESCRCDVPYSVGGLDFVTDGNGISVDALLTRNALAPDLPPYRKPGLIAGNIVRGNGGRGLHVFDSGFVHVVGNTFVENLQTDSPAFERAAEAEATCSRGSLGAPGIVHRANVVVPRPGKGSIGGPGLREHDLTGR